MKNQLKTGSLLSYVQMFLHILISIIYTPIALQLLGKSEYGLWSTASSTVSVLSLLNFGFSSGYVKYYTVYKKNNDEESIRKLNGLYLTIFFIIGIIALCAGCFMSSHLKLFFDEGLTADEYRIGRLLVLLLTINTAISFPMGVFSNIINAHERFIFLKLIGIINTVLVPLINLPVLFMGFGSIGLVVVSLSLSLIVHILHAYYVLRVLRQKFTFRNYEKGIFWSLLSFCSVIAINLIVDQINWNIDKILLGRYKGTAAVAVYAIGATLYGYFQSFSVSVSNVFTARVHRYVVNIGKNDDKHNKELTELFTKVGRIQFLVLALVSTGFIFFGKPFLKLWIGNGYDESYYVMLLLSIPAIVPLIQNVGIQVQRALNKHHFRSVIYLFMALFNLVASIILCRKYGAVGAAIGTAASLVLANGIIMNFYYHKKCYINILFFWKNIISICKGLILPVIFGTVFVKIFSISKIWELLAAIALYSCVYALSMWFLGINEYEKKLALTPLKKLRKLKKQ